MKLQSTLQSQGASNKIMELLYEVMQQLMKLKSTLQHEGAPNKTIELLTFLQSTSYSYRAPHKGTEHLKIWSSL